MDYKLLHEFFQVFFLINEPSAVNNSLWPERFILIESVARFFLFMNGRLSKLGSVKIRICACYTPDGLFWLNLYMHALVFCFIYLVNVTSEVSWTSVKYSDFAVAKWGKKLHAVVEVKPDTNFIHEVLLSHKRVKISNKKIVVL